MSAATESPASETTLRIATSGFVDTFNPFISIYLTPTNIIRYVYESLVQNDAEDGSPTKGPRRLLGGQRRRPDLDLHPAGRSHLVGRRADHLGPM